MIEIVEICESKLKGEIESIENLPEPIKLLLDKGFDMKLEDLANVNHFNNFLCFRYLSTVLIYRLCEFSPVGYEEYSKYLPYFEWLVEAKVDYLKDLIKLLQSLFEKEIRNSKDMKELIMWLGLAKDFTDKYEGQMEGILRTSYLVAVEKIWADIELTYNLNSVDKTCKYLESLICLQSYSLLSEDMASIVYKNLERALNKEYDLDGHQELMGVHVDNDRSKTYEITEILAKLNLNNEDSNSRSTLMSNLQTDEDKYRKPPEIINNSHKITDFSVLTAPELFYAQETSQFYVRVYRSTHPDVGLVAIKEYVSKSSESDLEKFNSEIEILQKLSALTSTENCFLKYYGSWVSGKSLCLVMEYHPHTLMSVISLYKEKNFSIPEKSLSSNIKKLLHSFATMESLGIYHKDIKPHNILVTQDFEMKIIDFSISDIKDQVDTSLPTGINLIQGTSGYVAPELQKMLEKGDKNGNYNIGKADVFSLGLTFLQMVCMEDLGMMNHEEYNDKLYKKIDGIQTNWVKLMLEKMLCADYTKRKYFRQLVSCVPNESTQIN